MRAIRLRQFLVAVVFVGLAGITRVGYGIDTKTSQVGEPRRITVTVQAMAAPPVDADAYADEKQDHLGDHHRPTVELVAPAGVQAAAAEAAPQSTVNGDLVMAETQLEVKQQHALTDAETSDVTSTVSEPSVAVRGEEILVTGNWFAAFSTNGGDSFQYVNPDTTFPGTAGGFCCDQVAIYDASHDLMIWFLQYIKTDQGNVARVAVAQGDDIPNQSWRYYDFSPQNVGDWTEEWFDYPDMALSDDFLYITTNTFSTGGGFTRAVVLRLPLAAMANYEGFSFRYFDTNQIASIRPVQGASDTMYFGAHRNLNTIRVLTWPENDTSYEQSDVSVKTWSDDACVAPGPDGRDWLGRVDGRITGAALVGDDLAFGWTAADDESHDFPHVRVALINKDTTTVSGQPTLWNSRFAFAYPSFAPNSLGTLGIAMSYGGGSQLFPSQGVGVLEDGSWNLLSAASGTNGPEQNKWGDYQAARTYAPDPRTWVAAGFSLQGGEGRSDIQVKFVRFGDVEHDFPPPTNNGAEEIARLKQQVEDLRQELGGLKQQIGGLRGDVQALLDKLDQIGAE